jgi:glycine/D-amino acid oxidase-like deaminating enzyme
MEQKREAIIIGAGLVGSLWAVYLSKAGYNVTIYERRKIDQSIPFCPRLDGP